MNAPARRRSYPRAPPVFQWSSFSKGDMAAETSIIWRGQSFSDRRISNVVANLLNVLILRVGTAMTNPRKVQPILA
jgi:hypothetical protein